MILQGLDHVHPRNERERTMAERLQFGPEIRLACQSTAHGSVVLRRLVIDEADIELDDQTAPGRTTVEAVGVEKRITIMFADVRNFTSFCEMFPPYDVIHALNRYFMQVGKVIRSHGGYIDHYIGDGLMALFGVEDPSGAPVRAVRAGLEMLEVVDRSLRPYFAAVYGTQFDISIGIHCGEAVVGTIGARGSTAKTVIGDAVNFASRIEWANREEGTRLLISEDTFRSVLGDVRIGKKTRVAVKGKTGAYLLYEVVGSNH